MFGGAATRAGASAGLDLTVDLFEAYDDDVLAAEGSGSAADRPARTGSSGGLYSGLGVGLLYQRTGERTNFRSWTTSAVRYYPNLKDLAAVHYQAGLAFTAPLGDRISLQGSPYAAYVPRFSMNLFPVRQPLDAEADAVALDPAAATVPDLDFTIVERDSYRYGGSASMNVSITDRTSFGLSYSHTQTAFDDRSADLLIRGAGANLGVRVTKNASLRFGFSHQEARFGRPSLRTTRVNNIDVGVSYRKPLSLSRRTFLRFSTGSVVADQEGQRRLAALGTVSLVRQIGRTWAAVGEYRRDLRFLEGFDRPIFSDAISTSLGGLVTRRVEWMTRAAYFSGSVGLGGGAPPFDSYSASARLRTALTRTLAAYIEYLFYHYRFDEAAVRPAGLPARFDRNGVRVGLSLWARLLD